VLRELKADPKLKHIPVIMISIVADKEIGYALGAVEVLTKPVDRTQLLEIVSQYSISSGSGLVLIVEDDEPTRALISKSLDQAGWVVAEAANGVEGIEQVSKQKPDLILLDLMMPVMDGFEFVESLRADEMNRSIPIIVISAKDLNEKDRQQLVGGVEHIIDKNSYTQDDLLQQVRSLVSQHKADDNKGSHRL
jgi:CheY-like chemotaxis protein